MAAARQVAGTARARHCASKRTKLGPHCSSALWLQDDHDEPAAVGAAKLWVGGLLGPPGCLEGCTSRLAPDPAWGRGETRMVSTNLGTPPQRLRTFTSQDAPEPRPPPGVRLPCYHRRVPTRRPDGGIDFLPLPDRDIGVALPSMWWIRKPLRPPCARPRGRLARLPAARRRCCIADQLVAVCSPTACRPGGAPRASLGALARRASRVTLVGRYARSPCGLPPRPRRRPHRRAHRLCVSSPPCVSSR